MHLETTEGDIDATINHPFYVIGKGWVAAGDLIVGNEVHTLDGDTGRVTGLKPEKLDKPMSVYNLEVEDFNSYFVGDGVLVHNKCTKPNNVRSPKGAVGEFSVGGYTYRIDTNKVAPGEGGFHLHIYDRNGTEIAKIAGIGSYAKTHRGQTLLKPSELIKVIRNEINELLDYVRKHLYSRLETFTKRLACYNELLIFGKSIHSRV